MAVFEKVQEIIVEELGKDAEEVKVETTFDDRIYGRDSQSADW